MAHVTYLQAPHYFSINVHVSSPPPVWGGPTERAVTMSEVRALIARYGGTREQRAEPYELTLGMPGDDDDKHERCLIYVFTKGRAEILCKVAWIPAMYDRDRLVLCG